MPVAVGIVASAKVSSAIPLSIPGCQMWFDATVDSSIEFGVAPKVLAWNDLSSNAWRFFNTASAEQPSRTLGGLKTGLYSIDFVAQQALNGPSNSGVNQKPLSCYAALKHTGVAADRAILGTIYTNGFLWEIRPDHQQLVNQHNTANIGNSTTVVPTNTTSIISLTYSAAGILAFYLNGTAAGSTTNNKTFTATTAQSRVGQGSGAQGFTGTIGEIIKYDTALLSPDRATINAYLAAKWL